ncbi:hypothetical protein SAMN05192559_11926, partial [Halobacillus karajensis]
MLKKIEEWVFVLIIVGGITLVGNWVGYDVLPLTAVPGMIVMLLICVTGLLAREILPFKM